ncbi:unannotated protein [freshwater metagenome]|uniref:Unannotated protein n=1 Tax=freshwater metagenome TaxID=449393 RepID=A0A6J7HRU6_9ZZZZ
MRWLRSQREKAVSIASPIVTWIERTYHRRRRQLALGRLTPVEYETIMVPQAALRAA